MTKRRNFYHRQAHHREDTCRHGRVIEKCDVCYEDHGELVEKVVCTENVQRTAELALPVSLAPGPVVDAILGLLPGVTNVVVTRSEEHTSELQSRFDLVCRLLLE